MARTMFTLGFGQNPFEMSGPWLDQAAPAPIAAPDAGKLSNPDGIKTGVIAMGVAGVLALGAVIYVVTQG